MKRIIVVLILLALLTFPALAQEECPGVRCPKEQPQAPTCASASALAALTLCLAALNSVRRK